MPAVLRLRGDNVADVGLRTGALKVGHHGSRLEPPEVAAPLPARTLRDRPCNLPKVSACLQLLLASVCHILRRHQNVPRAEHVGRSLACRRGSHPKRRPTDPLRPAGSRPSKPKHLGQKRHHSTLARPKLPARASFLRCRATTASCLHPANHPVHSEPRIWHRVRTRVRISSRGRAGQCRDCKWVFPWMTCSAARGGSFHDHLNCSKGRSAKAYRLGEARRDGCNG
mmetsp:Transcript_10737/g.32871  ORF Transcript_10737/g.32871 Transcript_10737/m.32871 type:complete len:226 (+) Transcript_10737:638-1315(+)